MQDWLSVNFECFERIMGNFVLLHHYYGRHYDDSLVYDFFFHW